jgi:2-polyprenyl-6-methoxyphenol hydroxylase-like FAD-dependent oxidoreductase
VRILTVGGGPGGLLFAILAKRDRSADEVVVLERNAAGATFGFGVVFSARALEELERGEPDVYRAMERASARWDAVEVRRRGRAIRCRGHAFSAIARAKLLDILRDRAASVGVRLEFGTEVGDPELLDRFDLVVAADGVRSFVRGLAADRFRPRIQLGEASYIWLGTPARFDALTLIFEETPDGAFAAHAYPFDDRTSTFIVEAEPATLAKIGLDADTGAEAAISRAYLERVFARHLEGAPLLANRSRWQVFPTVTNATWRAGRSVLLGDAAHSAHFSVGSGTRMAFEDALALAGALRERSDLGEALALYEGTRRPEVERLQGASLPSQRWFETFPRTLCLELEPFALHCLTRTGRVTGAALRRKDPEFFSRVETAFSVALPLRDRVLTNRWVVEARGHRLLALPGGPPGLFMVVERGQYGAWADRGAPVGLELTEAGEASVAARAEEVAAAGFDLLSLRLGPLDGPIDATCERSLGIVRAARAGWPASRPLAACFDLPPAMPEATLLRFAAELRAAGCDLAGIRAPELPLAVDACDAVRNGAGLSSMLVGEVPDLDEAGTLLLSGRVDLVRPTTGTDRAPWDGGELPSSSLPSRTPPPERW